jgi:hypothetical protein
MAPAGSRQSEPSSSGIDFVMLPSTTDTTQKEIPNIFQLPTCNNLSVHEISVDELQHHYGSGALSAYDYVKFCLDRIQQVHRKFIPN